jgi:(p)ppGpp synthase/HD superfamily hydrolase
MRPIFEALRHIENIDERARLFATIVHGAQLYGGQPYMVHTHAVVRTLERFGHDSKFMKACGYLHDTIEDTEEYTQDEIKLAIIELFGNPVYDVVYAVTNEPGKNRKEKALKTYPKIAANGLAQAVKLADRITNHENCILTDNQKLDMYRKEYPAFRDALNAGEQYQLMWKWLDFLNR